MFECGRNVLIMEQLDRDSRGGTLVRGVGSPSTATWTAGLAENWVGRNRVFTDLYSVIGRILEVLLRGVGKWRCVFAEMR